MGAEWESIKTEGLGKPTVSRIPVPGGHLYRVAAPHADRTDAGAVAFVPEPPADEPILVHWVREPDERLLGRIKDLIVTQATWQFDHGNPAPREWEDSEILTYLQEDPDER